MIHQLQLAEQNGAERKIMNSLKRICVITTVHYYLDTRIYYRQIRCLSEKYLVDYYAPCAEEYKMGFSDHFVPLYAAKSKLGRSRSHLDLIASLFKKKYAVYHLHDPELIPLGIILKLLRQRVIFDIHENILDDVGSKEYLHHGIRRFVLMLFRLLFNVAQRTFDMFILAEDSYQYIMKTKKYEIIHNYPLLQEIAIPQIKKWDYGLVYVGSITTPRGVWNMLHVFQKVQHVLGGSVLHLIGPFDEVGLSVKVADWMDANGLRDKVCIYGRIPNEEVFEILRHNSVGLCLLNRGLGFEGCLPTKMFEYMMASIPVVATDFPLWEDIIEDSKCGVAVDPTQYEAVAIKVVLLLSNLDHAKMLGCNGLVSLRTKYNWEAEARKLLSVYSNLID